MMFGTIRYDRESQHAEFIDRTESVLGDAATEHAACDKCRLTKLRCTGQRSGCDRCRARGIQCVYSAAGSRDSRKGWKNTGSVDLKVKKPREKRSEKPKEKPKRQGKASGSKKAGNAKPKAADQRKLESVNPGSQCQDSQVAQPSVQISGKIGHASKAIRPKIETGLEQNPDRSVQHGVLGVLAAWPQPHQLGLDLPMTTSPYDGLPEIPLDPGFFPTGLVGTSNYTILEPDNSPEDDNFAFFTSDSPFASEPDSPDSSSPGTGPSSEATSPMFTNAPGSPTTADTDTDIPYRMENDDTRSCNCLGLILGTMDELDDYLHPVPESSTAMTTHTMPLTHFTPTIDSMLASLKTRIFQATKVIHCTMCQSRSEHLSLLTRACEMIVRLAERVTLCYQAERSPIHGMKPFRHFATDPTSTPPPTPAPSPPDFLPTVNPANIHNNLENVLISTPSTSTGDEGAGMFFGRYKTDPSEYETLMRVLIVLQLRALTGLLGSIIRQGSVRQDQQQLETCTRGKGVPVGVQLSDKQIARVQAAQSVVGSLILRLEGVPQGF